MQYPSLSREESCKVLEILVILSQHKDIRYNGMTHSGPTSSWKEEEFESSFVLTRWDALWPGCGLQAGFIAYGQSSCSQSLRHLLLAEFSNYIALYFSFSVLLEFSSLFNCTFQATAEIAST